MRWWGLDEDASMPARLSDSRKQNDGETICDGCVDEILENKVTLSMMLVVASYKYKTFV